MFEPAEQPPTVLDALHAPADVAAWAATAAPGSDVVGPLAVIDPATVDGAAQVDLLIALERQMAWLTARQLRVLASLDGTALDWAGKEAIDYTQEQVGAALRLSPGSCRGPARRGPRAGRAPPEDAGHARTRADHLPARPASR